jgi:hypothetical protein
LRHTEEYKNNQNARKFLTKLYEAGIIDSNTFVDNDGAIVVFTEFVMYFDNLFTYRYDNKYYSKLKYYVNEDKYVLEASSNQMINYHIEAGNFADAGLDFNQISRSDLVIKESDLVNVYFQSVESVYNEKTDEYSYIIDYSSRFK